MSYRVPTFLVTAALIAGGCGSDDSSSDKPATSGSTAAQETSGAPHGHQEGHRAHSRPS
jgi:hypothetical protein